MTDEDNKRTSVQKLVISELLIALVLIGSFIIFSSLYAQKPVVEQKDIETSSLNVDVYAAGSTSVQELITGFGTARADREVIVAAQVTGEIIETNPQLKVGHAVVTEQMVVSADRPSHRHAGDLLLKIDPREFEQRLEQAGNRIAETKTDIEQLKVQQTSNIRQLKKAKAVLATLKEEYDRIQQAVDLKAASASDLNRSLLDLQRYEDTVIQLENQVDSIPHQIVAATQRLATSESEKNRASDDVARTTVRPPFDGVLSEVMVEQGQYVRAGEPLVRLTSVDLVEIPISVGFDDFLQLEKILNNGVKPRVNLAENETADSRWNGFVVRASPEANSDSRTVEVFVEFNNANTATPLLPGAFVHARIDGMVYENRILIPREAIVDGHVYVVDEKNITHRKRVTSGRRLQSMVIIEDGVSNGDRVVMTNLDIVEDGSEVVVQSVRTPQDEVATLRCPEIRLLNPAE